jgi:hypothetical protein
MQASLRSTRGLSFGLVGFAFASCAGLCGGFGPGKYSAPDVAWLSVKVVQNAKDADLLKFARVRIDGRTSDTKLDEQSLSLPKSPCSGGACTPPTTQARTVSSSEIVTVIVEGLNSVVVNGTEQAGEEVLVRRTARGRVPLGRSTIVLDLDESCLTAKGAPVCATGTTCKSGQCSNDAFTIEDLLIESEDNSNTTAVCVTNGPPAVFVGTGENDFEAVAPGTALPVFNGSQGGQHMVISVQTANMNSKGLTFLLSGVQVGTNVELPYAVFSAPVVARGARCEATGFRYEITGKYGALINKPADITVTAREASGKRVSQTIRVIVGD